MEKIPKVDKVKYIEKIKENVKTREKGLKKFIKLKSKDEKENSDLTSQTFTLFQIQPKNVK